MSPSLSYKRGLLYNFTAITFDLSLKLTLQFCLAMIYCKVVIINPLVYDCRCGAVAVTQWRSPLH